MAGDPPVRDIACDLRTSNVRITGGVCYKSRFWITLGDEKPCHRLSPLPRPTPAAVGLRSARDCPEQDAFVTITPAANHIHKRQEHACLDDKWPGHGSGVLASAG